MIPNSVIPNSVNISFRETSRYGTSSINTMRFNSFPSVASALFNVVPHNIKSIHTLERFKAELDKFLHKFPDTPPTPGYLGANRNSLLEWAGGGNQ